MSTKRGKNVDAYILLMKSEITKESSGPTGLENKIEVKSSTNEESNVSEDTDEMKDYTDAKKMQDQWSQKWIDGYCSDRIGEQYMKEMAEYARKWKDSEKRMDQLKDEYYNKTQK